MTMFLHESNVTVYMSAGARGDTPTSPIGRESPSPFATLGRGREVSPMKSYEWF